MQAVSVVVRASTMLDPKIMDDHDFNLAVTKHDSKVLHLVGSMGIAIALSAVADRRQLEGLGLQETLGVVSLVAFVNHEARHP